uniref:Reverse transcriptase Ty1/copia-type domain-containing protein n=1 Tax=Vitis vinifera TaxID=29760 RepID=A5BQK7_VITVI|nr:hypothetical protein VITISV_019986 [Vitis vinifera]
MEASLVHTCPDTSKIDPFNGTFFKRWQERVFSIIDVVNLEHILTDPKSEDGSHLLPTKKTGKTSYELWKGYAPNITYLKVWGCLAKFLLLELKKQKLGPKTFDAMLVSSGAPLNLWEEAILSACHIQNRISYEKNVCKLVKSLYGLKQAPKQWHNKFDHMLVTNGYSINNADKCIYNKYEDNTCVVICLYVDDMLIFGTSLEVVCETKKFLGSKFDMKDLGEAEVILGIKIIRTPNGLKLSQEHYIEKILRKFEHFDCKPLSTPYDPSSQLKKNRKHSVAQIEYAHIIGSLMYLMNCTRPDIAYAIGRLNLRCKWLRETCESPFFMFRVLEF